MNHTKGKKNQWHTDDVLRDTLTHEEKTLTPLPYSNVAWGPTARACLYKGKLLGPIPDLLIHNLSSDNLPK